MVALGLEGERRRRFPPGRPAVKRGERCTVSVSPADAGAPYDIVRDAPFPLEWFDPGIPRRIFRGFHTGTKKPKGGPIGRSFLHFTPRAGDDTHPFALHVYLFLKFVDKFTWLPFGRSFEHWKTLVRRETELVWGQQYDLVGLDGPRLGQRALVEVHVPPDEDRAPRHGGGWRVQVYNEWKSSKTNWDDSLVLLDVTDAYYSQGGKSLPEKAPPPRDKAAEPKPTLDEVVTPDVDGGRLKRDAYIVAMHELGHALGLPEEYGWLDSLAKGAYVREIHAHGAPHAWERVMAIPPYPAPTLHPDEASAFASPLTFVLGAETVSPRAVPYAVKAFRAAIGLPP